MTEIKNIKELHSIILEIANVFHQICKENGIVYYMLGGTMLGAVRHKGFIPWDDDMDFGVPRSSFNRLISILEKNIPDYYKVRTIRNHPGVFGEVIKIEDRRTVVVEKSKENIVEKMGVFIDIFPLDYTNKNKGFMSRNWWVLHIIQAQAYKLSTVKTWKTTLTKIVTFFIGDYKLLDLVKSVVKRDGDYFINYYGFDKVIPFSYFDEPILYEFENFSFYGVCNPDGYLKCVFGDYMQLPPLELRQTHIVSMYYK